MRPAEAPRAKADAALPAVLLYEDTYFLRHSVKNGQPVRSRKPDTSE